MNDRPLLTGDTASCSADEVRSTPVVAYHHLSWALEIEGDDGPELLEFDGSLAGTSCVRVERGVSGSVIDVDGDTGKAYTWGADGIDQVDLHTGEILSLVEGNLSVLKDEFRSSAGVLGDVLYVVDWDYTLRRWDISDPTSPVALDDIAVPFGDTNLGLAFHMTDDWAVAFTGSLNVPGSPGFRSLLKIDLGAATPTPEELPSPPGVPDDFYDVPGDLLRIEGDVAAFVASGLHFLRLSDDTYLTPPLTSIPPVPHALAWASPDVLMVAGSGVNFSNGGSLYVFDTSTFTDAPECPANPCGDGICTTADEFLPECMEDCQGNAVPEEVTCYCNPNAEVDYFGCLTPPQGTEVPLDYNGLVVDAATDLVVDGDRAFVQVEGTVPVPDPWLDCVGVCGTERVTLAIDISNPTSPLVLGPVPAPGGGTAERRTPRFLRPRTMATTTGLWAPIVKNGAMSMTWDPFLPSERESVILDVSDPWCGLTPP